MWFLGSKSNVLLISTYYFILFLNRKKKTKGHVRHVNAASGIPDWNLNVNNSKRNRKKLVTVSLRPLLHGMPVSSASLRKTGDHFCRRCGSFHKNDYISFHKHYMKVSYNFWPPTADAAITKRTGKNLI